MLHAAAMLLGLISLWFLATLRAGGVLDLAFGAGAALLCAAFAWRAGGSGGAFTRAPRAALATAARMGAVFSGALATIRTALAADVALKPALVRIRTRGQGGERADFAGLLSSAPGMVVAETDADGILVHVMDEDAVDAADLGRLERVAGVRQGGAS